MKAKYRYTHFLIILLCFFANNLLSQPENDECAGAINLFDVANWCSTPGQFTTVGATPSSLESATCISTVRGDVWYKFTAIATDVTITVNGAITSSAGGTLLSPEVTLYRGGNNCTGTFFQERCDRDKGGFNTVELYKGALTVGQEYLVRIQSATSTGGTFQLCINNYNPPVNPGSDCVTASVLCDKSQFVVQQVIGAGSDVTELDRASCLNNGGSGAESNSTWFVWTADEKVPGPLSFTLTPLNSEDDLDFMVFELPDGIGNCLSKVEMRCMFSGESFTPSPCMGPTGLRAGETDTSEPAGCNDPRQNNFVSPIDMQAGKSYALVVNNFSSSGNGFSIEFGGEGEFQGPQANFITNAPAEGVCYGTEVGFTDASSFQLGNLTNWEWSFGVGATPATASGEGPHNVSWDTPGTKSVVLTVQTNLGCQVTEIKRIEVLPCCEDVNAMTIDPSIVNLDCPQDATGVIDLTVTSNAAPYTYLWSTGSTDSGIQNLSLGDYTVTITNDATCDTTIILTIAAPDAMQIDTLIKMPTCGGGIDGAITLLVTGGVSPYAFNWNDGSGFVEGNNTLNNLPVGIYPVSVRDANGCQIDLDIDVRELELILDPNVVAKVQPSCFGDADGSIQVVIDNGLPPFQYDWSNGVTLNTLKNIAAGTYTVHVTDANDCIGDFTFVLEDHPPLEVDIEEIDVSCFGVGDGNAIAHATGGFGNYTFAWSDGQKDSSATELVPGEYTVIVLDENACEAQATTTITQPNELFLDVANILDVICNGDTTGVVSLIGSGGNLPYEYSIDGINFQPGADFSGLIAGDYTFYIRDTLDCTASVNATVNEPPPLTVSAGVDQKVDLGFDTEIKTLTSPPGRFVTYQWNAEDSLTISCLDCPNPTVKPVNSTVYTVMITDDTGCIASDDVLIQVVKNRPIYIPNAFSPNFDGINDYFTVFGGPAAQEVQLLRVFDRWGALVFEAKNIPLNEEPFGWNGEFRGKQVNPGVYAYYTEILFIDNEVLLLSGDITVTR